ncbi:unnamed protein product [Rotaria socialis]|nr:unnamed protein product [Rotaria socialis]CAF4340000.1 unnamed protein product [Rotaria socialis]CAF4371363.1 unnamed protein product [Rotaria socialis]CAF4479689.1 unnamed protein product [Rotaria socialis]CAF4627943.1 unnamed protein product [Rotaria socialis]
MKTLHSIDIKHGNALSRPTQNVNQKKLFNIENAINDEDQLVPNESSRLCLSLHNCSSYGYRNLFVSLAAIAILVCCLSYQCYECRSNKAQLDRLAAQISSQGYINNAARWDPNHIV